MKSSDVEREAAEEAGWRLLALRFVLPCQVTGGEWLVVHLRMENREACAFWADVLGVLPGRL